MTASANLELVRSIYADLERGDFGRVFQAASEWAHPEFEWVIADGPTAGSFTGVAEAEESAYGMLAAWEEFRFEVEEYRRSMTSASWCSNTAEGAATGAERRRGRRQRPCLTSVTAR
jgi:ketosteroid isomerase-like protein